jgi:hypothetical protein
MSEPGFASLGPSLLARKGGAKPAMRPQVAPLVADEAELAALAEEQLEDLGWNDMGDADGVGGAQIVPINADVAADHIAASPGPIVRRQQKRLQERVLADAAMTGPEDREPEYDEQDEDDYQAAALYDEELGGADDYEADEHENENAGADSEIHAPLVPEVPTAAARTPLATRSPAPAPRPARMPAAQAGRRAAFTLRLDADRHLKLRLAATMQGISAQALVTEALDRLLAEHDDLDIIANHLKRH